MFTPLLIATLVNARQGAVVNLELKGVRMINAAPILAKALGLDSLSIGPTIKDEVILLRAKDASVADVKARFATALNATWEQRSDGWWLTQTSEQKIEDQKAYTKYRYRYFASVNEKAQKKIRDMKPFDEAECKDIQKQLKALSDMTVPRDSNMYRMLNKFESIGPVSRLGYRMALRLTPEMWLKTSDNNPRVVFSSKPTGMQLPLPFQIDDLVAKFVDEQNNWVNFAGTEQLPGPSVQGQPNAHYYIGSLNENRRYVKPSDIDVVTMALQLDGQALEINGYDGKGRRKFATNVSLPTDGDDFTDEARKAEIAHMAKKAVTLTGDAAEYLDLYAPKNLFGPYNPTMKPVSASLLAKILQPEKIDPLSFSAADVFLGSVDTPNVLMVMADDFRSTRFIDFSSPILRAQDTIDFRAADGWTLVKFTSPIAARKRMPDRPKLGKLLRFINDNRRPLTLEEQAGFQFELPWDARSEYTYQSHLRPLQTNAVESNINRMAMRIYGSMDSGIRERAKKGPISFTMLSEATKLEIFRSVFYSQQYETQVQIQRNYRNGITQAEINKSQELDQLFYDGIYQEKTFLFPNGLTNNLTLTMTEQSTKSLYCGRPDPPAGQGYYGAGRSMSPSALGQHLFRITNPAKYEYETQGYYQVDENNIKLASTRNITIKMNLDPSVFITWQLSQTLTTDPQTYTTKTLPPDVIADIQKGYAEAERNDKFYGNPRQTQTNPPPR